jgi:hypothetical protein
VLFEIFFAKMALFGQRETQRKMVLFWGGPVIRFAATKIITKRAKIL